MEELSKITQLLDETLRIDTFSDSSQNGLQVQGMPHVRRIAGLVDASREGFDAAIDEDADMILVHHGLFWGGPVRLTGIMYERVRPLITEGVSLYAAHLPLDAHPGLGNNAELARIIDVPVVEWYAEMGGNPIACMGEYETPCALSEIIQKLDSALNTRSTVYDFGPEIIQRVGIVSGAGCAALQETCMRDADVFITGEPRLNAYHEAQENEINIAFAGHYSTEQTGVKKILEYLAQECDVETVFIDIPCDI